MKKNKLITALGAVCVAVSVGASFGWGPIMSGLFAGGLFWLFDD